MFNVDQVKNITFMGEELPTEMYVDVCEFVGSWVTKDVMCQVWIEPEANTEFYIDFNNLQSFKMAIDNFTGVFLTFINSDRLDDEDYINSQEYKDAEQRYNEYVVSSFKDLSARQTFFTSITANLNECVAECPGCIHASFTFNDDNVLLSVTGS